MRARLPVVPRRDLLVTGPYDLVGTLRPLVRGHGDRTVRLAPRRAIWAMRTLAGPVSLDVRQDGARLTAEAWGDGADAALDRLEAILGVAPGSATTGDLRDAPDRPVADLARRLPGIRIPATGAVLDVLVPAILEQKVTGTEARRAWQGLIRTHGADAPGPLVGLRLTPEPATLARLPTYAYHPFGVEGRRAGLIRRVAARPAWFEAVVGLEADAARERLTSVPGIGPWTAAEVAVRALGDIDAVSVGDFHLPNLVSWALAREPRANDARMLELLAPYAGLRALVVRLLESGGLRIPRYGPRLAPRRIESI